jgi:peptidoglycan/xylan/chitin deacetylase (PgdA/CDA1 family)
VRWLHPNRVSCLLCGLLALAHTLSASSGFGQVPGAMDGHGNLRAMPFELNVPIVRTSVERSGDVTSFVNVTSWTYERTVAHFQEYYARHRQLAPGWSFIGYAWDYAEQCMRFTLTWDQQYYRFEVTPDETSGGAIITLHDRVTFLVPLARAHTVAPYRATDVGAVPLGP